MDATLKMNSKYTNTATLDEKERQEKASKNLLWFGIISIVMMFGGLTSAVIVSKGGNFWLNISLPPAFWVSSGLIILSSLAMQLAKQNIEKNNISISNFMLVIAFILASAFCVSQFVGYKQLVTNGHALTGQIYDDYGKLIPKGTYGKDFTISYKGEVLKYENGIYFKSNGALTEAEKLKLINSRNTASSFLYMLTFLHLAHLAGGMIYLIIVLIMGFRYKLNSSNCLKIKLSTVYWHFLGFLWIYLFVFLQYIH